MDSQKIENLLNLALSATPEERLKSMSLNVGFSEETDTWEVIVKYHGDITGIQSDTVHVETLIAGYAIITLPENLLEALAGLEEIEYIEKPKRLFFSAAEGKRASCIFQVTTRNPYLNGEGVIVAVIDSGIQYAHPDFRKEDGTTRIIGLWDQTIIPDEEKGWYPPMGYYLGVEFSAEQINEALEQETTAEQQRIVPSRDNSGHGTAVTGIAAGNGRESRGINAGVATKSELLIVKLGNPKQDSFPRTTELMRALAYVVNKAVELGRPVAINLSFGNNYGSHRGNSLVERFLDNVSEIGRSVVCVGSGNEGAAMGHAGGQVEKEQTVELSVGNYERTVSVQLWKDYADRFLIEVISPGGERRQIDTYRVETLRVKMEETELLIYTGEPSPYSIDQEIYFDFLPVGTYINQGIWRFRLTPVKIVTGQYQMYLPSSTVLNAATKFLRPTPEFTLTIPSTAGKVITVGAYSGIYDAYADFSGRGYVYTDLKNGNENIWVSKPDIVAPGVEITSTSARGGYGSYTGTSFATPFATGSAALMMEWGIVRGNDPYLYGEKVKAYFIRGARQLPGYAVFPNAQVGYGALCLSQSLPL